MKLSLPRTAMFSESLYLRFSRVDLSGWNCSNTKYVRHNVYFYLISHSFLKSDTTQWHHRTQWNTFEYNNTLLYQSILHFIWAGLYLKLFYLKPFYLKSSYWYLNPCSPMLKLSEFTNDDEHRYLKRHFKWIQRDFKLCEFSVLD